MKRTVQEKYEYNKRRGGMFSSGYCLGVSMYDDYVRQDGEGKKVYREFLDNAHGFAREGDDFSKGVMCAYRDKANERKDKRKR